MTAGTLREERKEKPIDPGLALDGSGRQTLNEFAGQDDVKDKDRHGGQG